MHWWEPEESVGRLWHRFVGDAASYPDHPHAAVELARLRTRLAVFFRGVGGDGGVQLAAGSRTASRHRLSWRQRLGFGDEERVERARFNGETLLLPARLACLPERRLNEMLYFWLAAFFAHAPPGALGVADPLQRDILALRAALTTTQRAIDAWPGLASSYNALAHAAHAARPRRALAGWEAGMEEVIAHALSDAAPTTAEGCALLTAVTSRVQDVDAFVAGRDYRPFLPVPLWGEVTPGGRARDARHGDVAPGNSAGPAGDRQLKARRRNTDQTSRKDPLVLHRFEHIPTIEELANLGRAIEDDDPDDARKAADALDEITLGSTERNPASRVRLDLELAPAEVETGGFANEGTYPEWDYTRQRYHEHHCRVVAAPADEEGADWRPDRQARRRIRAIRRRFEALRPQRQTLLAQCDGDDLDLNALVRSCADIRAGGGGSDRVYIQARDARRDLAVAILVDASLSTDGWVDNRRVLDVEKEALLILSHGLAACGDDHALFAFSSRKRSSVSVRALKEFHEPFDMRARRRIEALRPGDYTRIGAAVRHTTQQLVVRPNRHRLLLLITDGKPNDLDHYEGRYGIEDTRRAVREARQAGIAVFGITVDAKARDYFPYLFGRGAYAIVSRVGRLPRALPAIYRQIVGV